MTAALREFMYRGKKGAERLISVVVAGK